MQPPLLPPQTSSFLAAPRHHPPHPTLQLTWILQLPLRSLHPSSSYSTSASSTSSYEPFFFLSGHDQETVDVNDARLKTNLRAHHLFRLCLFPPFSF